MPNQLQKNQIPSHKTPKDPNQKEALYSPKINPDTPKSMLTSLKRWHPYTLVPTVQKPTDNFRPCIFERTPEDDPRVRRKQQFEMGSLSTGAEEESVLVNHAESMRVLDSSDGQGRKEGFVVGVEDGVLRGDLEGVR